MAPPTSRSSETNRGLAALVSSPLFSSSGVVPEDGSWGLSRLELCLGRGFFFREPPGRRGPFLEGLRRVPGALSVPQSTLKASAMGRESPIEMEDPPPSRGPEPSSSPAWRLRERVRDRLWDSAAAAAAAMSWSRLYAPLAAMGLSSSKTMDRELPW